MTSHDRHEHEEFDAFVVDTRRAKRWTESRRTSSERREPVPPEAQQYRQRQDRVDATRVMPTVESPLPPLPTAGGASAAPRRTPESSAGSSPRVPVAQRPVPAGSAPPAPPRAPAPGGSSSTPPRRRMRIRWGRLLALVLVVWLAFLVITPLHAWSQAGRADTTPDGDRPASQGGHNYLLLGSDSRVGLSAQDRERLGATNTDGQRTDSIILVHVPDHGGKSALISIPRDSYVPIPGHGSHKINAASSLGGPKLLTQTVESVADLRIDGTLEIGFGGFADVVDSLGGVELCPRWDMKDPEAGLDVRRGCQVMNGPTALGYVRTRHTDPRGDLGRADRQREFLGALMKKAASPSTVLLPNRYWSFTHSAAGAVQMSEGLGMGDVLKVLTAMRGTGSGDTLSLMMPIADMGYPTSDGSAVKWNTAQARSLFDLLRQDTPLQSAPAGTNG